MQKNVINSWTNSVCWQTGKLVLIVDCASAKVNALVDVGELIVGNKVGDFVGNN